jgi:caffeoyl-CoA O-methyltransferase
VALVDEAAEAYADAHTTPEAPEMQELLGQAREQLPFPSMLSGLTVGRLLQTLAFAAQARLALEIGTYAGYSALAIAEGLAPGGRVITCELAEAHAAFARRHIEASPYGDRVDLRVGPALDTIAGLEGPFDLVFIDADKTGYAGYFEAVLPKLSPHGVIAIDNTLQSGEVLLPPAERDASAQAIADLNDRLVRDERVVSVLLTVRDGVTLVRRR